MLFWIDFGPRCTLVLKDEYNLNTLYTCIKTKEAKGSPQIKLKNIYFPSFLPLFLSSVSLYLISFEIGLHVAQDIPKPTLAEDDLELLFEVPSTSVITDTGQHTSCSASGMLEIKCGLHVHRQALRQLTCTPTPVSPFSTHPRERSPSIFTQKGQLAMACLLQGGGEKKKWYSFKAFSLLFLGKHNKATAGRHLFFS